MTMSPQAQTPATLPETTSARSADAWQRRFGVPWERVECAVRAVSDRAVAASRRKFAAQASASPQSDALPG